MKPKCPHDRLTFDLHCAHMTDANVKAIEIKCRCEACGMPMRWLGLPLGSSLAQPTTDPEGLELRAPVVPADEHPSTTIGVLLNVKFEGTVQ